MNFPFQNDDLIIKNKKKTIRDCIDVDGLTKIEDQSCRKVIERDELYKVLNKKQNKNYFEKKINF
jgi:hypothetical protein